MRIAIEWMVDSGADITTVRNATGANFDLTAIAATASPTTGGSAILIYNGLDAEFTAESRISGLSHTVISMQPVGVKPGNTGSEILGMDALAINAVDMEWSPSTRQGTLWVTHPSTPTASTGSGASTRSVAPAFKASQFGLPRGIVDHDTWVDVGGVRVEKRLWRA